ncbi:X-ray repair cross-complementing protein 6-like [Acanthaster planci]|uniref:X-ray repair cross-complementing protein 6-like n=1 Tax=Acanthaster planci TaxID=133434 RepID=A0A8B7XRA3_ACAPL|nr:X-ray repair cross-complementing protein 6-like [Acanthaster planci]
MSFQKMIVFSNKADHQAVLLLGNDIHILQNLQRPGAPQIEELEALVTDHSSLRSRHGYIADPKLNHALQKCRSLFSQRSDCVTIRRKRIFLFTNLDGPQDPTVQRNSKLEARQLYKEDVEIKLVYFDDESKPFNASLIYNDLLLSKDDAFCGNRCDRDQFDARVFTTKLEAIKGPRRRLHFSLGQDLNIGIGLYNLVQEKKLTKSFSVGQNRNPADKDSSNEGAQLPARNGGILDSSDRQNQYTKEINEAQSGSSPKKELGDDDPGGHWMYSMTYRGKEIKFTEQEKTDLCTFGETGLSLLGFKPRHEMRDGHLRPKIKDDHQLGHPMFVFPDELMVSGSTRLFSALLQRCLARDVVAICRLIVPSAWYLAPSTQIVALLPQKEELDEHGKEICPAGFHLIKLPGPRDLRKVPKRVINKVCGANNKANKMQIDKAKAMIQKLQFSFRSENYENPSLKRHMPTDDIVDNTKPNHAFFAEKADIEIDEFKRTVYPEGYAPAKKQRSQGTANALTTKTMEQHVRDGSITTCTVAQLKAFCVENRLATRGKKADLIREVCGFYNCDPPAAK